MEDKKADIKADISTATDRNEELQLMEPLVLSEGSRHRGRLSDLAVELASASADSGAACRQASLLRWQTLCAQ